MDDRPQDDTLSRRTLAARAPESPDRELTALTPPIHVSTTFIRDPDNGYSSGHVYGRMDNGSIQHAETRLAALEHAADALLFTSGMAAATTLIMALPPTHIVAPQVMYWGLRCWMQDLRRHGHSVTCVEMSDMAALKAAILPDKTGLVWIETPSNPLWTITDIAAVSEYAHKAGAIVCADSTVATPVLSRPLDLGVDIVMHSATKYLNGHSDVVAGVLATSRCSDFWQQIRRVRNQHGAVLGPFDAWLLSRGLRTLDVRVREQSKSAMILAERLVGHPLVAQVLYPGLPVHAGHAMAARQMTGGFGGMLSLRMKAGAARAILVAANVRLWRRATSFGGIESLIEHHASLEGAASPCPADLLRLSVGLEDPEDLYADLSQALEAAA
jgi:cystathionine gamma-synthase